jgi:hypothetical protein
MDRTRAWRRAQQQRIRQRVRQWSWFDRRVWLGTEAERESWIARRSVTRAPCSCPMCGHRRYWQGPGYQERKAMLFVESLDEA